MNGVDAPAFLDTSYIVRYLTDDPPEMAAQAAHVIDSGETLILSELALVESAYVLDSNYKMSREDIVEVLIDLVQRQNLLLPVLPKARALEALDLCRRSKRYSFTDVFLWAQVLEGGYGKRIYSFDRRFPSQGIAVLRSRP